MQDIGHSMIKFPLALLLIAMVMAGCRPSALPDQDFVFTIEFYPSFIEDSRLILEKKGSVESLSLSKIWYDTEKMNPDSSGYYYVESNDSSLSSRINQRFYGGSSFIQPVEQVLVKEENLMKFNDSLVGIDLGRQLSLRKKGYLDGITIVFRFQSGTIDNVFGFRCPFRSDKKEFRIIRAIFDLMKNSFKTSAFREYTERLDYHFRLAE